MEPLLIGDLVIMGLIILNTLGRGNNHFSFVFNYIWIFVLIGSFIKIFDKLSLNKIYIRNLSINLLIFKSFVNQTFPFFLDSRLFLSKSTRCSCWSLKSKALFLLELSNTIIQWL